MCLQPQQCGAGVIECVIVIKYYDFLLNRQPGLGPTNVSSQPPAWSRLQRRLNLKTIKRIVAAKVSPTLLMTDRPVHCRGSVAKKQEQENQKQTFLLFIRSDGTFKIPKKRSRLFKERTTCQQLLKTCTHIHKVCMIACVRAYVRIIITLTQPCTSTGRCYIHLHFFFKKNIHIQIYLAIVRQKPCCHDGRACASRSQGRVRISRHQNDLVSVQRIHS